MKNLKRKYRGYVLELQGPRIVIFQSIGTWKCLLGFIRPYICEVECTSLSEAENFIDGWIADEKFESECDSKASRKTEHQYYE